MACTCKARRVSNLALFNMCLMSKVPVLPSALCSAPQLETIPMYNYPNFLNLFTTFMYIPFSFAYIIPMLRYGNAITPEQTSVPKRFFAVMGALDGLSGIMQIFASTYLGGSLIILLSQVENP